MPEKSQLNFPITTSDGVTLAASIFGASDRVIVVNSAVGVPKYFYSKFARYLSTQGFTVVIYDYRGIGDSRPTSLRRYKARYQDWGSLDSRAVIGWCINSLKPKKIFVIAHSGGAQILGLVPELPKVDGVIAVASPSGAWRHWPSPKRLQLLALSYFLPVISMFLGFIPLKKFKLGEDIPGMVAAEWARWARNPDFVKGSAFGLDLSGFNDFKGPFLAISVADDKIAPREPVAALNAMYSNAQLEEFHIDPVRDGIHEMGHFGFFKEPMQSKYWQRLVEWLNAH